MTTALSLLLAAIVILIYYSTGPRRDHLAVCGGSKDKDEGHEKQEEERILGLTQHWPGERNGKGATIDIVAIHGLGAQSPSTWETYQNRKDDADGCVHWLRDENMLHTQFPKARIYTYDWLSGTHSEAVEDGLRGHAATLLDELRKRHSPGRHLIFIASCFGGLLLAKAVTLAFNKKSRYYGVLEDVTGILFLGTPFGKSDAGTSALIRVRIAKAMGGEATDKLATYLTQGNDALSEVVEDFESIVSTNYQRIGVISYYETKPTQIYNAILPQWMANLIHSGSMILVPRGSVRISGSDLRPIHVKHAMLNKFFGPSDRNFQTICSGLQDLVEQARKFDVHQILRDYYGSKDSQRLRIERISGERLPMEKCYINLCIVEHTRDRDVRAGQSSSSTTNEHLSRFSLASRLQVETPPESKQVTLQSLFTPRKRAYGSTSVPNRILIWGRAGVGKSTLCKKIVHDVIHRGLWEDLFDYVFWIPLRELRSASTDAGSLERLILNKFFRTSDHIRIKSQLRNISPSRTLYILDGLDEVSFTLDEDTPARQVLQDLLECNNVIITSRPHTTSLLHHAPVDLELETIGFFPAQVEEYLEVATEVKQTMKSEIQSFIQDHPIVQSLVRIPVQLDAICYGWGGVSTSTSMVTMTSLYRDIESKLWEKYLNLRDDLALSRIQDSRANMRLVEGEISFFGKLAFHGLYTEIIEFSAEHIKKVQAKGQLMLNDNLLNTSFLRSSDNSLKLKEQTYHFIHLTFQEYFAARYFVHCWISEENIALFKGFRIQHSIQHSMNPEQIEPQQFLSNQKYNVRYDRFWRFVVGMLQEEDVEYLKSFFETLERPPYDLLGPAHQRLIIHCLNEVYLTDAQFKPQTRLLERYKKWILFEYRFSKYTFLAREVECPDRLFVTLLRGTSEEKEIGMSSLANRQQVSPTLLQMVISELKGCANESVRANAYRVLGANLNQSSGQQVSDFWQNFHRLGIDVRKEAVAALWAIQLQPPVIEVLVPLLHDQDPEMRIGAMRVLKSQTILSETIIKTILPSLDDSSWEVRYYTLQALEKQSQLPEEAALVLVRMLGDEDEVVRHYVTQVIGKQKQLPETVVKTLIQMSDNRSENNVLWIRAARVLGGNSQLLESLVESLLHCFEKESEDLHNRAEAIYALENQRHLPERVIKIVLHVFLEDEDEDEHQYRRYRVRTAAASVLANQNFLSDGVVGVLLRLFEDETQSCHVRIDVANILTGQSQLTNRVIEVLTCLFQDENGDLDSLAEAAEVLARHTQLPESTVEVIVRSLADQQLGSMLSVELSDVLYEQDRLSPWILRIMLLLLGQHELSWKLDNIIKDREELYQLLPESEPPLTSNLLRVWLRQSFRDHRVCIIDEDSILVHYGSKPVRRIPLDGDQLEAFKRAWRDLSEEIGAPAFSLDAYSSA